MTIPSAPEIIVETGGLVPNLSGVGYYTQELLRAYAALPGRWPIALLAYRFCLRSRPSPSEEFLKGLARSLDGRLEVHRRLLPGPVYARLRRLGFRPPAPVDAFAPPGRRIYFFPNYVGEPLWRGRCVPVVYDFGFMRFPRSLPDRDDLYLKRYLPRTLKRALQVVVISDCVKRELERAYGLPGERITTVYPAVDHSRFRPDIPAASRFAARKKYGLPPGYIFSLGTLEPRKNFAGLIEAFALLPDDLRRRAPLVIAGGPGWKNRDVRAAVRRLGLDSSVKLLGYIADDDRAPLIRDAAVLAFPSLYEGFGMPVLESLACGTPVVASARGALPEVAGESALYVDPLRPEDIARGLKSVLENPELKEKLSTGGLKRAAAFQWEASARVLAGVFEKAAAAAGRPRPR
jgi:glycosyltransferase involved in cell wall biosynthesis